MANTSAKDIAKKMDVAVPEYKPTITLDEKLYPDLKNLKVDDVVDLAIKVKINHVSKDQWDGNKLHVSGTIENAKDEETDSESEAE